MGTGPLQCTLQNIMFTTTPRFTLEKKDNSLEINP